MAEGDGGRQEGIPCGEHSGGSYPLVRLSSLGLALQGFGAPGKWICLFVLLGCGLLAWLWRALVAGEWLNMGVYLSPWVEVEPSRGGVVLAGWYHGKYCCPK